MKLMKLIILAEEAAAGDAPVEEPDPDEKAALVAEVQAALAEPMEVAIEETPAKDGAPAEEVTGEEAAPAEDAPSAKEVTVEEPAAEDAPAAPAAPDKTEDAPAAEEVTPAVEAASDEEEEVPLGEPDKRNLPQRRSMRLRVKLPMSCSRTPPARRTSPLTTPLAPT